LTLSSAVLAKGADGVCLFVNDKGDDDVLSLLSSMGIKLVVLRCAGYNNIDLNSAKKWGITVLRVPSYSPHSVAEHALGLMLALNRKIPKAFMRVREGNFSLAGLMGFDMYGKTVGIIGVGRIGKALASILNAMGCRVLGVDRTHKIGAKENGVEYVGLDELLKESSIISLHCPLTPQTHHLINDDTLKLTQQGVMIINTGRGGLVDTLSLIRFLKNGHIGYLGLDVYEQECGIFFEDLSCQGIEQIGDDCQLRFWKLEGLVSQKRRLAYLH
jgi:D-lactate dehydrogenase